MQVKLCGCDLCLNAETDQRAPRDAGQCHGYNGTAPCCRSAVLGSLLCHVCAREQSPVVRTLARELAPRGAK